MIYCLTGKILKKTLDTVVISCGGVGYLASVTASVAGALPGVGGEGTLYTVMNVSENDVSLFGFATEEQRACFLLLTGVSGVGPKVGLAILNLLNPDRIALAISAGDHKAFTAANGVGPKLAQRITLELRDKFAVPTGAVDMPSAGGQPSAAGNAAEAVRALTVLGFTAGEAAAAVGRLDGSEPVESLVRQALKALANR